MISSMKEKGSQTRGPCSSHATKRGCVNSPAKCWHGKMINPVSTLPPTIMAQREFGSSDSSLSAMSQSTIVLSTNCPGTLGSDILALYPVQQHDPMHAGVTLHYMAISFVFESGEGPTWSLDELRFQDYQETRRRSSGVSANPTESVSTPNPYRIKPRTCSLLAMTKYLNVGMTRESSTD